MPHAKYRKLVLWKKGWIQSNQDFLSSRFFISYTEDESYATTAKLPVSEVKTMLKQWIYRKVTKLELFILNEFETILLKNYT